MNLIFIIYNIRSSFFSTLFYSQFIIQCASTVVIIPFPCPFPPPPSHRHFAFKRKCEPRCCLRCRCSSLRLCCCGLLHAFCLFIYLFMQISVFFVQKLLRKIVVQLTWQRAAAASSQHNMQCIWGVAQRRRQRMPAARCN